MQFEQTHVLPKLHTPALRTKLIMLALASLAAWRFDVALIKDTCDPAWGIPPEFFIKVALLLKALSITFLTDLLYPWAWFVLARSWPSRFGTPPEN